MKSPLQPGVPDRGCVDDARTDKDPTCDAAQKDSLHECVNQANIIALNALITIFALTNDKGQVTRVHAGGVQRRTLADCRDDVWRRIERLLTPEMQQEALDMLTTVLDFKSATAQPQPQHVALLAKHKLVRSEGLTVGEARRDLFWSEMQRGGAVALPVDTVTCRAPVAAQGLGRPKPSLVMSLLNRSFSRLGAAEPLIKRWSCCHSTELCPNHHVFSSEGDEVEFEQIARETEKELQGKIAQVLAQALAFAEMRLCPACGAELVTKLSMERHFIRTHCETSCDVYELDEYYLEHYVLASFLAQEEAMELIFPHKEAKETVMAEKRRILEQQERFRAEFDGSSSSPTDDDE